MLSYRGFLLVDCGLHALFITLTKEVLSWFVFVCLSVGLLKNDHPAFMKLGGRA